MIRVGETGNTNTSRGNYVTGTCTKFRMHGIFINWNSGLMIAGVTVRLELKGLHQRKIICVEKCKMEKNTHFCIHGAEYGQS